MNADDLKKDQARKLFEQVSPILTYLVKLERRMERRKFPPDDELAILVSRARRAIYELRQNLHYLSCDGVERKRRD
jgi:hypothetical protein